MYAGPGRGPVVVEGLGIAGAGHGGCDKHPKKMTVAQAVNPMTDVPSEVRSLQIQHSTLEISPLITIITAGWLQLGMVICNQLARWSVVMLV